MSWVWAIGVTWLMLGALVGVLIGRGIRLADRKQAESVEAQTDEPNFVVDPAPAHPADAHSADAIPQQAGAPSAEHLPSSRKQRGA